MTKNIPITTLLLTYLFICGSLYLIGFWSTFDVDVFSLISLYDIPKNFVYPLMLSQVFYVLNMITGQYIHQISFFDGDENNDNFIEIKEEWSTNKQKILGVITSINLWVTLFVGGIQFFFDKPFQNPVYWTLISIVLSYYLFYKFFNYTPVKVYLKNVYLRYYIGHFITFFPIACFSSGKVNSLKIYNNSENKYFDVINSKNQTQINDKKCLKFLGFVSDKYIYSTINNQQIYILSKESCDGIVISKN
ncbi:hypothetical protein [Flavobacterium algicola]|uniref:hypothetical protein n=1 Tax=Flavobacterium algicola TaxID=556529 RepID=UPI001EFDE18E|nr:hypothetical protein [Flavobacterium algicola]MCG9791215.1 hypothetical protein [Flavobacterium algicola]